MSISITKTSVLFVLPAFGQHNITNALGVIAVAYQEGLDMTEVAEEMLSFPGVKRRFSEKKVADMTIVDDYAHHPAEIRATIDGARQNILKRNYRCFPTPYLYPNDCIDGRIRRGIGSSR